MGKGRQALAYLPGYVSSRRTYPEPKRKPEPQQQKQHHQSSGSSSRARRRDPDDDDDTGLERKVLERKKERLECEELEKKKEREKARTRVEESEKRAQQEETLRRIEEQEAQQQEKLRKAEEYRKGEKKREDQRKQNLAGCFAVQDSGDADELDNDRQRELDRQRREQEALAATRKPLAHLTLSPARDSSGPSSRRAGVPDMGSSVTDAFTDPAIARAADPGVIAAHAMRFAELKRRFRTTEMGGPCRGRSRSRSRRRYR